MHGHMSQVSHMAWSAWGSHEPGHLYDWSARWSHEPGCMSRVRTHRWRCVCKTEGAAIVSAYIICLTHGSCGGSVLSIQVDWWRKQVATHTDIGSPYPWSRVCWPPGGLASQPNTQLATSAKVTQKLGLNQAKQARIHILCTEGRESEVLRFKVENIVESSLLSYCHFKSLSRWKIKYRGHNTCVHNFVYKC